MTSLTKKCFKDVKKVSCALAKRGRSSFQYKYLICKSTRGDGADTFYKISLKLRVPHDVRYTGSFGVDSSHEFFCSDSKFHLLDLSPHSGYRFTQCRFPVGHPYHRIGVCDDSHRTRQASYDEMNRINNNVCRKDLYDFLD